MGAHVHRDGDDQVTVGPVPRAILLALLAAVAVATVVGVWQLWPNSDQAPKVPVSASFGAPGVTFPHAKVTAVQPACPLEPGSSDGGPIQQGYASSPDCGNMTVVVDGAPANDKTTVQVPPEVAAAGLREGDRVQLVAIPASEGQPATYTYFGVDRRVPLFWFALGFAVLVLLVARLRGLMALVALAFSGIMITKFMLPALLAGESGFWTAVAGTSAIMFVILYGTHGPSVRTSTALAGTLLGIGITALVGEVAIDHSRLTGISDESGGTLSAYVTHLNFPGLLTCGLIIAGLGVLNDVTITQSSSVWELRAAAPHMPRRRIFTSAMRIGRDHIASTIYTIAFAYAGASIVVLLLLVVYDQPLLDIISSEEIAEEIVRTLASGVGLVLAVPITTAIAAAVASPAAPTAPGDPVEAPTPVPDDRHPNDQFWKPRK